MEWKLLRAVTNVTFSNKVWRSVRTSDACSIARLRFGRYDEEITPAALLPPVVHPFPPRLQ